MTARTAILYVAPGADPARDRIDNGRATIVAVPDAETAATASRELAEDGVGLIELCGGFSPVVRARVADAVGDRAKVSSMTYGIESLDAAARFKADYDRGETPKEAFILLSEGANPQADRFVATPDIHPTTIVPVPDGQSAARIAGDLAGDGVLLIELYGGFGTHAIAAVLEAVDGRAAVGAGSFALDAFNP